MKDADKTRVTELIEAPLAARGYELAEVVLSRYRAQATLKVFVYGSDGVSLDECAALSDLIGDLIEGTDLFDQGYRLQVSSPGLDRALRSGRDFRHRIGETVRVDFLDPRRRRETAEIVSATDEMVEFRNEQGLFTVPVEDMEKAKIIY
jgi:ribosome maturation factor RimP